MARSVANERRVGLPPRDLPDSRYATRAGASRPGCWICQSALRSRSIGSPNAKACRRPSRAIEARRLIEGLARRMSAESMPDAEIPTPLGTTSQPHSIDGSCPSSTRCDRRAAGSGHNGSRRGVAASLRARGPGREGQRDQDETGGGLRPGAEAMVARQARRLDPRDNPPVHEPRQGQRLPSADRYQRVPWHHGGVRGAHAGTGVAPVLPDDPDDGTPDNGAQTTLRLTSWLGAHRRRLLTAAWMTCRAARRRQGRRPACPGLLRHASDAGRYGTGP